MKELNNPIDLEYPDNNVDQGNEAEYLNVDYDKPLPKTNSTTTANKMSKTKQGVNNIVETKDLLEHALDNDFVNASGTPVDEVARRLFEAHKIPAY